MCRTSLYSRDIDGILLLDKPLGISSNNLLQKVRRLFFANKAGHTGALDPLATGMLPVCFGEATKFSQYLLDSDKRYRVTALLGKRTDTFDSQGKTVSVRPVSLERAQLEAVLDQFRGQSMQVPPMFSALKHQGRPLYEYARKGIAIARAARFINVYDLRLRHWDLTQLKLEIHCSKGTYIRTIIDDVGERLGCGAHVIALRRIAVASYPREDMVTLTTLQDISSAEPELCKSVARLDALLLPIESAVDNMPAVDMPTAIAVRVRRGQAVKVITKQQAGLVRLRDKDCGCFFGIGKITKSGWLVPHRLIVKSYT